MITLKSETIHTDRLALLPLQVEHADEMAVVLSDPGLHTFIGGTPDTAQDLRARYERWVAGSPRPGESWCNWVIQLRDTACLTGYVQATVTADDRGTAAEIAWVVGTPWQQRGIATEATQGLVAWLRKHPVHRVVAHIHPDHKTSAAVATAAGLTPTDQWHDGEIRWQLTIS
ncbi:GNAT family N-acetyltransferase [Streptomyces yunnanensis]|uniref:GNAT family N-acetyltransferase n=1 Tax=Streptomyces yunnanensis TaxID=156453 RepID=A0ABY8AKH7_9ACTN|nr:GNAT family N-acetyltransferase [Streptomyces yunnanensis]WEB45478.1 GNAT family N-acetyltransferase [Streptomyces yunnanensis]